MLWPHDTHTYVIMFQTFALNNFGMIVYFVFISTNLTILNTPNHYENIPILETAIEMCFNL